MDGKLRNMTSIYFTNGEAVLCLYRMGSRVIGNSYVGAAGGHFEKEELNDARACVLRELREELGLDEEALESLSMRYITLRLAKGEIRQNYYFFARLKDEKALNSSEGKLEWIRYEDFEDLNMPVSAKHMMLHYVSVGRFDDKLYGGITQERGTNFVELREF